MENGKKKQKINMITWKGKRNDKRENNIKMEMIKLFNKKPFLTILLITVNYILKNYSVIEDEECPFWEKKKTF